MEFQSMLIIENNKYSLMSPFLEPLLFSLQIKPLIHRRMNDALPVFVSRIIDCEIFL